MFKLFFTNSPSQTKSIYQPNQIIMKTSHNYKGHTVSFIYRILTVFFIFTATSASAQTPVVFEEWAQSEGVQEFFYKNVTVTDGSNNVYVAGATLNGDGNYDLLISKFDKYGVHLWSDTIAGAGEGHDMAAAIAIDPEGDILVCGTISEGGSAGNNMLLVKYDTDGFEYWR